MININHIYAFLELVEQCNFNSAAEKLHITQSGLSRKISAIEERVNQRLFERTTRFVRPTWAALTLARHWREAISHYQAGLAEIGASDSDLAGPFVIGVSATSRHGEWQQLSDIFSKTFPNVHARIESMPSQDVMFYVRNGDLDVGFCGGPIAEDSLGVIPIEQIRYRALLSDKHPLASRGSLTMADLRGASLSLVSAGTWPIVRENLNAFLGQQGMLDAVAYETNFIDLILKDILDSDHIGIHPLAKNHLLPRGVTLCDIDDLLLTLENVFIWRKSTTSPIIRSMVSMVRRHLSDAVPAL
ncbi:LysR family transcriptional regulator [Glaciimonas soli]|uniref:LysR family transcriptional regulator n=1 Tax=Glaciimonas soli TaxID=2590999 RepID=A0A843YWL7_9BURK|nr:LysR family transcriptional regulator [Glaciimonas soli]MQR02377.1 LysR family transcriptional regulator [Glaciimonas soli]